MEDERFCSIQNANFHFTDKQESPGEYPLIWAVKVCGAQGYGSSAVWVIHRVSILADFVINSLSLSLSLILPPFSLIRDFRKQNTRGNVSKISVSLSCYRHIGSKSTNHSPLTWRRGSQKVTLAAVIGGFRSDLSNITRKTDGNFGNVSESVSFFQSRVSTKTVVIMLCHANICTIEIKLQRDDRRIVGGNWIPILRIFSTTSGCSLYTQALIWVCF